MASGNGTIRYLSPPAAVQDFFDCLSELRVASGLEGQKETAIQQKLLNACQGVSGSGERVVKCLDHQMRQQNRASELSHEVLAAFQLGLRRLIQLKSEVEDLKKVIRELHLAEQGLDSCTIGAIPSATPITSFQALQEKQRGQRDVSLPGSAPSSVNIPRATSYEDFLRHKDLTLSSSKRSESSAGGSSIRKAKSESDVATHTLKKKVESLSIDNDRLKVSEKNLVKKNIKLTRNCKALEKERDVAEDRLKIEQTQRDSIEKLRQRNKELEQQLRELCDSQVIREREAAKAAQEARSSVDPMEREGQDVPQETEGEKGKDVPPETEGGTSSSPPEE